MFEEEDYQPMQYGYRLVPDVSEQRTVGMLREVEEDLLRRLRQRPAQSEVRSPFFFRIYFWIPLNVQVILYIFFFRWIV